MRTGGDSWGWGEEEHGRRRHGLLADCCLSCCNSITSCFNFFCCCWLLRDCFGGRYRNPSAPYAPSAGLPFGHHPRARPTDPFLGPPGPAPSRFGAPGGPPGVPGPLAGPLGEDPTSFAPPGPPGPPGPAY